MLRRIFNNSCLWRPQMVHYPSALHTSTANTAGHSKWANIRHIKALKDGQRSLLFIKLARQIRIAVQDGGSPNPSSNTLLRQALDEATKHSMPAHTIQGILKKAAGTPADSPKLKRYVLEARVLNKIFMVMVMYTDKYAGDRMVISSLFRKGGATVCDTRHMFTEKGFVDAIASEAIAGSDVTPEQLEEICTEHAIESEAEELDVLDADKRHMMFICDPLDIEKVRQKLVALGYTIENAEHVYIPNAIAQLTDAEMISYKNFKDKLRALNGVEDIYDNVGDD